MVTCGFRKSEAQILAYSSGLKGQIKKWWGSGFILATFLLHSKWAQQGPSRHQQQKAVTSQKPRANTAKLNFKI